MLQSRLFNRNIYIKYGLPFVVSIVILVGLVMFVIAEAKFKIIKIKSKVNFRVVKHIKLLEAITMQGEHET